MNTTEEEKSAEIAFTETELIAIIKLLWSQSPDGFLAAILDLPADDMAIVMWQVLRQRAGLE